MQTLLAYADPDLRGLGQSSCDFDLQSGISVENYISDLAAIADAMEAETLHYAGESLGGILGLAPRISVLAQVWVIAALSVALEAARGLTIEEYSRWHRAGALGEAARRMAGRTTKLRAL